MEELLNNNIIHLCERLIALLDLIEEETNDLAVILHNPHLNT